MKPLPIVSALALAALLACTGAAAQVSAPAVAVPANEAVRVAAQKAIATNP